MLFTAGPVKCSSRESVAHGYWEEGENCTDIDPFEGSICTAACIHTHKIEGEYMFLCEAGAEWNNTYSPNCTGNVPNF